jgi:hypothetical protein
MGRYQLHVIWIGGLRRGLFWLSRMNHRHGLGGQRTGVLWVRMLMLRMMTMKARVVFWVMRVRLYTSYFTQIPVLPKQLTHASVQFVNAQALCLDEALLVLNNSGQFSKV